MSHAGHHHTSSALGDHEAPSADPAVARLLWVTIGALLLAAIVAMLVMWPTGEHVSEGGDAFTASTVHARVRSVEHEGCSYDPVTWCRLVTASVTEGGRAGEVFVLEYSADAVGKYPGVDDDILVSVAETADGEVLYSFYDYERGSPLIALTVLFVVAVVALGRWRGVGAIAGLAVSMLVIVVFLVPAILEGSNAVAVALATAVVIAVVALFLAHGVNVATAVALLSTFAAMSLTVALAFVFVRLGQLTGFTDEETQFLSALDAPIDPRGLLLAGILIGSLGVLDDVTVTQVSASWELRRLHPDEDWYWIYQRAIRIGRDHISSTVNTLFLAYAGASLSLLLLFAQTGRSLVSVATSEVVAVEIVRALVGSIGLVASVPIATGLSALILRTSAQASPSPRTYPKPTTPRPRPTSDW